MNPKLLTLSLIALLVCVGLIIAACLERDELLLTMGLMGFAVNGYNLVIVPRLVNNQ